MLCFRYIICVVYALKSFSTGSVHDYIIVNSSTDLRRNFTVNVICTAANNIHFFRNQDEMGNCVEKTCSECHYRDSLCNLTNVYFDRNSCKTFQLIIKNIQRTSWNETISVSNGTNLTSAQYFKLVYRLIVYTKIEHFDCSFKAMEEGIMMICKSTDIFPKANAFSIYNDTRRINGTCSETNSTDGRFLKNSTCLFNIAKDQLQPGDTKVTTTMFLYITGDEKTDINFGRNISTILHLEHPQVTLDEGCTGKSNYIFEGQTGQCTCHRTDTSDVAPEIVWYYPNNTIAANGSHLTFTAARNSSFICNSRFSFGWSINHTYTPKVAYGPGSVNFSLDPKDENMHLCEDTQTKKKVVTVTYECTASEADVYPSIIIEIMQNNSVLNSIMKIYNVTNETTLENGGVYNFSCLAKNTHYGNNYVSWTLFKNVIEAPNKPKITMQRDTNRVVRTRNATENTTYIIQCEVLGGYPLVSNITLKCGPYANVSIYSDTATLAVNATTPALDDMNCSCSASHISTCYYNNKTVVSLRNLLTSPLQMESTLILAAPISAALCVVVIILLATFLFQRNGSIQQKKYYNLNEPSETNNFDIYFYQSSNNFYPNVYKSYDMIIPTITSAACGPLNSKENIYFNSC